MTGLDFDDFYRAEYAGLVALATAVLGRRAGADDLVQDAMVEAYRRWSRLGHYEAPRAWVRRVMVQRATKAARKQRNEADAQLRSVRRRPPSTPQPFELDPGIREALAELPAQQRAAMALHYLEDLSVAHIAELLGVADGTVKAHLARGRLRLAADLGPSDAHTTAERDDT